MMRKKWAPSRPWALPHLPKLEKSPLSWSRNRRTPCAYQAPGNVRNDRSFTQGPSGGRAGLYCCLLRAGPAGHSQPLAEAAIPCTLRLMALWSQAANLRLSRNKPLHWWMSGIVPMFHFLECAAPDGTSQLGSSKKMVWDLGQFLLSKQGTRAVLLWDRKLGICLLTAVCLYTHRMRISKLESRQF